MTSLLGIKNTLKKYPRLTRAGLLILFALTADQIAKTYDAANVDG